MPLKIFKPAVGKDEVTFGLDDVEIFGADDRPAFGENDLPAPSAAPPVDETVVGAADFPRVTPEVQLERDRKRLDILQTERNLVTDPRDIAALDKELLNTRANLPEVSFGQNDLEVFGQNDTVLTKTEPSVLEKETELFSMEGIESVFKSILPSLKQGLYGLKLRGQEAPVQDFREGIDKLGEGILSPEDLDALRLAPKPATPEEISDSEDTSRCFSCKSFISFADSNRSYAVYCC